MKKLLMAAGVAVMAIASVSCSKTSGNANNENKALGDSIAMLMGQVEGSNLNSSYERLDSAMKAGMSKDGILAGIKTVLMADTADKGYLTGMSIGLNFLQQVGFAEQNGVPVDHEALFAAFAKAFKADSATVQPEARQQLQALMSQVQVQAMKKQQEAAEKARAEKENSPEAVANKKAGEEYLAKTVKEDAAYKTTESGLAYKEIKAGNGASPVNGQQVNVKYTGRHIDGSEFDSSKDNAVKFPVNGVVPGFSEALKMMKPGAIYQVIIPANLAYGVDGTPDGSIGANETLIFDIELVSVDK